MVFWTLILILLGTAGAAVGFSDLSLLFCMLGKGVFYLTLILLLLIWVFVAKNSNSTHIDH